MSKRHVLVLAVAAALSASAQAALITQTFTGDSDCGISASKTYTHKVDLGAASSPALINGVQFTADPGGNPINGSNYTISGYPNGSGGTGADGISGLLGTFRYAWPNSAKQQVYTLTGLTSGQQYDLRFYAYNWGGGTNRPQNVSTSLGETLSNYNEDGYGKHYLSYTYAAPVSGSISVTFDNLTENSFHGFGFTNQVVPEPATLGLAGLAASSLLLRRRRQSH